jgi:hypothetical protein
MLQSYWVKLLLECGHYNLTLAIREWTIRCHNINLFLKDMVNEVLGALLAELMVILLALNSASVLTQGLIARRALTNKKMVANDSLGLVGSIARTLGDYLVLI